MRELFEDTEQGLSADEISEFERKRGNAFPDDFRAYLHEINGGWLNDSADFNFGDGHTTGARNLFGFNGSSDRDITTESKRDGLPRCFLPIGDDLGGADLFVLDLRTETLGKIYIRAINVPPNPKPFLPARLFPDSDDLELYHHVADSFSEFLSMITGRAC